MAKTKKKAVDDPVVRELTAIKDLLTLALLKSGSSQVEVAKALAVDQSVVSRRFPAKEIKPFRRQE